MTSCSFCTIDKHATFWRAIADEYPVTDGHTLVVPREHIESWSGVSGQALQDLHYLVEHIKLDLKAEDSSITGFNVGYNEGTAAGQTVPHIHLHIIPRRVGDVADPRGGIRGVIPERQKY